MEIKSSEDLQSTSNIKDINANEFMADVIEASSEKPIIVDFWAPWCAPCKTFAPVFEAASETYTGVYFAKVNSEEEQELAESFGIWSIPTLVVIREQIILYSKPGAVPAYSLEGLLDRMAKLDMTQVRDEIANSKTEAQS